MGTVETVVFDLDGTLVDSLPDIAAAANQALLQYDHPPLSQDTIRGFIGNGLPRLSKLVMQNAGLDSEYADAFLDTLLAAYADNPCGSTVLYPGVEAALSDLQHRGMAMGICSNKTEALCVQVVEGLGLAKYFDVVMGGDSLPQRKPAPEPLLNCVRVLGGAPAVYVGDSEVDAQTAQAAGIPFAFYTEGYAHTDITSDRFRFSHFRDLVPSIGKLGA